MKYAILCVTFCVLYLGAGAQFTYFDQWNTPERAPAEFAVQPAKPAAGGTAVAGAATGAAACDPLNCICHGELGCFRKRRHCMETSAPLPESPTKIGTRFLLYKRGNRGLQAITTLMSATQLYSAGFDARRSTVVAVHGWTQAASAFEGLKNVLLKKQDHNVILVDWEKGAGITGRWPLAYTQPVQNTRVIGKHLAVLLTHIATETGINLGSVHLIGASLGAQAAGYAGMYLNGTVGRITGLDPAKPNFEGLPADCKLEATDAQFVDVIHTNMDVAGVAESVGHVDFFPNGGRTQPECNTPICSHLRAKSYFRASVWTDCQFKSTRCDGAPCGAGGCPPMGYNAFKPRGSVTGNYCLSTTGRPPYCTDKKDTQVTYPGKVNPGTPGGNNPINPSAGNGKAAWFGHGKPLNPGGPKPGWKNPGVGQFNQGHQKSTNEFHHSKVDFGEVGENSGVRHQITFTVGLTLFIANLLARFL